MQVLVVFEPRPAAAATVVAGAVAAVAAMHLQVSDASGRGTPKLVRISLVKRDQPAAGIVFTLPRSSADAGSASDLDAFALDGPYAAQMPSSPAAEAVT